MKCFSSWAHSEHIDILGNAKNVLVAGQNVANMIPIPGLSPAIDVLIKIIDKVEVRTALGRLNPAVSVLPQCR